MSKFLFLGYYKFKENDKKSSTVYSYGMFYEKIDNNKKGKVYYVRRLVIEDYGDINEVNLNKDPSLWGLPVIKVDYNNDSNNKHNSGSSSSSSSSSSSNSMMMKVSKEIVKENIFCINSKFWASGIINLKYMVIMW